MRNVLAILCLLSSSCGGTGSPTLAIRGAFVVDVMDGPLRPEQTVLITGNRIVAVGPVDEVRIPGDAEVIDAAGG
jgi:imidazolonepropionase-like amidohydrolase